MGNTPRVDTDETLFWELIEASLECGNQIPALDFRAKHAADFDRLNELERAGYLKRTDNTYSMTLLGMRRARSKYAGIEPIVYLCEHVFRKLRRQYLDQPGIPLHWPEFVQFVDMPEDQVFRAVQLMDDLQFWGTRPAQGPTPDSMIGAGEDILKYETLDEVLDQVEAWRAAPREIEGIPLLDGQDVAVPMLTEYPSWYAGLPKATYDLLIEIRFGIQSKRQFALPSMGLRATIDNWLNEVAGDQGPFARKLQLAKQEGHLSATQHELLRDVLEVGHASMHRAYFPTDAQLRQVLDVVEHLLQGHLLQKRSKELLVDIPKRPRKS